MTDSELLYDEQHISFLEDMWGDGFLSPGGADEAKLVVEGLDLRGKRILDIGSGSGAIGIMLVRDLGAAEVVGIDVEAPVCDAARTRVAEAGLEEQVTIELVSPGPLPFDDNSFDIVYSKDSIIHIPDKESLASEAFRVLRSGGWFAASDWLISHDGEPSPEMQAYIQAEALDFAMASPPRYEAALTAAGFVDTILRNRNPWYREVAKKELDLLTGAQSKRLQETHGGDFIRDQAATWTSMITVLETGEHCPHHVRGRKP